MSQREPAGPGHGLPTLLQLLWGVHDLLELLTKISAMTLQGTSGLAELVEEVKALAERAKRLELLTKSWYQRSLGPTESGDADDFPQDDLPF